MAPKPCGRSNTASKPMMRPLGQPSSAKPITLAGCRSALWAAYTYSVPSGGPLCARFKLIGFRGVRLFIMRPKLVLTLLLITELFFLILLCSPGLWRSKQAILARQEWLQARSPDAQRSLQAARDKETRKQYVVCALALFGAVAIILYGALQRRRHNPGRQCVSEEALRR